MQYGLIVNCYELKRKMLELSRHVIAFNDIYKSQCNINLKKKT